MKRTFADRRDAVRNRYTGQARTPFERIVSDAVHGTVPFYLPQKVRIGEAAFRDRPQGLWEDHILQLCHGHRIHFEDLRSRWDLV